jgi:RNA polymerase sigma-70 factor (ECF subfamily)
VNAGAPGTPLLSLFLREREHLRRIAAGMGMAGADVDDVLQDVSVQVLRHEGTFERESGMKSWLIRTTVNHCLTEHRRRFRHSAARIAERRPDVLQRVGGGRDATDRVGQTEQLEVVRRTLLELDGTLLTPMVLRYFCDLKSGEIAEILNWNASTVRARLRQARMILARKLLRRGVEPK